MATTYCFKCGSPLPGGSQFCQKCGSQLPGTSATPPPTTNYPSPAMPAYGYSPPPQKNYTGTAVAVIIIAIVIVIVLAVVIVLLANSRPGTVDVTAVTFTSHNNACGINGWSGSGFTDPTGGAYVWTNTIPNNGWISCTINSVTTTTSGFSLSGVTTPITIPGGGTATISFTIHCPSSSFTGVLSIDVE